VAVTAAIASPRARRVMRQGAVYGVAGILKAGDTLGVFARGVGRGAQQATESAEGTAGKIVLPDEGAPAASTHSRPRSSRARAHNGDSQSGEGAGE
jgi:hypothetical protein